MHSGGLTQVESVRIFDIALYVIIQRGFSSPSAYSV